MSDNIELELNEMQKELKDIIVSEHGEQKYYDLVAEKVKSIHQFKLKIDAEFGEDEEKFKDELIRATLENNADLPEEQQQYELAMTTIALDVFMND